MRAKAARTTPVELTGETGADEYFCANAPFDSIEIGLPTWGAPRHRNGADALSVGRDARAEQGA